MSGYLVFQIAGKNLRLGALASLGGKNLFVMFRDETSGKQTYGGGRYLNVEMPQDGKTVIDFNRAFNPYCAYNPYASHPLPPRQNRLAVPIHAGALFENESH